MPVTGVTGEGARCNLLSWLFWGVLALVDWNMLFIYEYGGKWLSGTWGKWFIGVDRRLDALQKLKRFNLN